MQRPSASRRGFLRATGGAAAAGAAAAGATGQVRAQESPYDGWFENVSNYEGTVDLRGESEVTVEVGAGEQGLLFAPAAIAIDPGTTVVWEWTGAGGQHNVVAEDADFESELVGDEGHTYERQFESEGIVRYFCNPHQAVGMKGAVAVGAAGVEDDLVEPGSGGDSGDGDGSDGDGSDGSDDGGGGDGNDGGGGDAGGGLSDITMMDAAVGAAAILLGCAFLAPVFYFAAASERPK